jgi:hypothetical protein
MAALTSRSELQPQDIGGFCRFLWGELKSHSTQIYPVVFNEEHFAKRLSRKIKASIRDAENAIADDLQTKANADPNFPEDMPSNGRFRILFDDDGTPVTLEYRVELVRGTYLSVGTVFVPDK